MNKKFLYNLLDSMSVSGHEIPLQKKVIAEMKPHCDEIRTDYTGNVICILNPEAPFKILLTGHIDEIGLIVTYIESSGLLRVTKAGGIRAYQYPGHQVVVKGADGPVYGAVIASEDTEKKDLKAQDLYIDIGAKNEADARKYVQEGDPVHFHSYHQEMLNGLLSARAVDDRGCAFIILEALKRAIREEDYEVVEEPAAATVVIGVGGMMCSHCTASVEKACMSVPGTVRAVADLEAKNVTVTGTADIEALKKAIIAEDYDILEG